MILQLIQLAATAYVAVKLCQLERTFMGKLDDVIDRMNTASNAEAEALAPVVAELRAIRNDLKEGMTAAEVADVRAKLDANITIEEANVQFLKQLAADKDNPVPAPITP